MITGKISAAAARRIAIAAQGLDAKQPPGTVNAGHMMRVVRRIGLFQIDSVNVLVRAHYLPLFARIGAYPRAILDTAAWGRPRRLFEYWAHEASLLPLEMQPLFRWRMARAERGERIWNGLKPFAGERRAEAEAVLARIESDGPLAASDLDGARGRSGWWEWGDTKRAFEYLFWSGRITTATRRGSFERVYHLTERVLPAEVLAAATPTEPDAQRELLAIAARALGIATAAELRDYFRLPPEHVRTGVDALVEAGVLRPVAVEGWNRPAFLHTEARVPRRVAAQALLAPFDPLIWERERTERLFGLRYRIGIYTPAHQRTHGYYVLPFLLDEALVARVDLKAEREAGLLRVQSVHAEPHAPPETADRLATELARMAGWLGLSGIAVEPKGDLATRLAEAVGRL